MQLKCVAVDDEPYALDIIRAYISKFATLKLMQTFDDAIAAAEFIRNNKVDLLFLDINMPDITGLELARSLTEKPIVIFTTAYRKFAYDGFELEALDYLLKPIEFERFSKAINKAVDYYHYKKPEKTEKPEEQSAIFVRSEYQLIKILLDDVEYIESVEDYIKIYITSGKPIMTLMTLKVMMEKLPSEKFLRIHRSYIVPVAKIRSLANKRVKLTSVELPVSDSYIDSLKAAIKAD